MTLILLNTFVAYVQCHCSCSRPYVLHTLRRMIGAKQYIQLTLLLKLHNKRA